ncbi:glycosyltransferase family 2 protein [Zoogloea oleivorans]|uniref:Glycosyltransferase family 2 protein n=1 Tax=Zoogloea oleivorans TaxID=1552750 RepID=A0A6C2CBD9_9RHOO|nr:glycosyltransferase family 2 protein [Zoogloea oleivorans]TYC51390.1 glycosyltransferase family 2 protein [Zoogloea oleivorans]
MDTGLPRLEFEAHGRIASAVAKTRENRASYDKNQRNSAFQAPFYRPGRFKTDRLLGWGRIQSRKVSNFISRLVEVDKLLSHTVLRPMLWRMHLGVTIPGQCFLLKTASFEGTLPSTDTFLDDLSIGLHAAKHHLRYHYAQNVVAFELPSYSFSALWKQRLRWATGFRQSVSCTTLSRQDRRLLWIHAFCYHLLPILHVATLAALAPQAPLACAGWLGILGLAITRSHPQALGAALAYPILFPLFHVGWWLRFFHIKP